MIISYDVSSILCCAAYGKVFLVRKTSGHDEGKLYAMKVSAVSSGVVHTPITLQLKHRSDILFKKIRILKGAALTQCNSNLIVGKCIAQTSLAEVQMCTPFPISPISGHTHV